MVGFRKEAREAALVSLIANNKRRKQQALEEYEKNPVKCGNLKCPNNLTLSQAKDGIRFCCRGCSNSAIPRISSDESRQKVSETISRKLKKPAIEKICEFCNSTYIVERSRRNVKTCTKVCAAKLRSKKASATMTIRGTHSGWHNRRGEQSYPEKYFVSVFENEDISGYVTEKKVGRWFIDFAFEDKMIAIEIDGRQHKDEERAETDKIKDEYLFQNGWKVFRIEWYNPINERNKQKLYSQIEEMKRLLK